MENEHIKKRSVFVKIENYLGLYYALNFYEPNGSKWDLDTILESIENKDDSLSEFLATCNSYGMLNSLVILVLIVNELGTNDIKSWFEKMMKKNTDSRLIFSMVRMYTSEYDEKWSRMNLPIKIDKDILCMSENEISTFIWDHLDRAYLDSIPFMDNRTMGVWSLGVYKENGGKKFIDCLEKNVYPYLLMKAKEFIEKSNDLEVCIFKRIIRKYLENTLSYQDGSCTYILNRLMKCDVNEVAVEEYTDFSNLINKLVRNEHHIYLTRKYVNQLSELIRAFEYYNSHNTIRNISNVKSMMPLFYLLVGENDLAYSDLYEMTTSPFEAIKWKNEYVIALYRCLLITKDDNKRKRLLRAFDMVYTNDGLMSGFIDVLSDISIFYKTWTKRIRKEFNNLPNTQFKSFCETWVINGKVEDKFAEALNDIKGNQNRSQAIHDAMHLLWGLTSHLDYGVRISPHDVELAFADTYEYKSIDEIQDWHVYNKKELNDITNLHSRFERIRYKLLSNTSINTYNSLKEKVSSYWYETDIEILSNKILIALRGIQSNPINMWRNGYNSEPKDENSLNYLLAYFLMGYYGEANIEYERKQGISLKEKSIGSLDIVINKDDYQFAIIEALKILKIKKDGHITKKSEQDLNEHLDKLMNNYDARGVETKILIIYTYLEGWVGIYKVIGDYLNERFSAYGKFQFISHNETKIGHHKLVYIEDGRNKEMHVFTALMM